MFHMVVHNARMFIMIIVAVRNAPEISVDNTKIKQTKNVIY